ncbi:MAG: methyltransferase domain-containing protein [Bacteroidetes bacterium]|nr:methyltransferase domain-containing protein [Bacteroidota bacterium]
MAIRDKLPGKIYSRLWGDRRKFGFKADVNDSDWKMWLEKRYIDFYQNTQQKGIGNRICKMAYPVITKINFENKKVLEIGPGIIRHLDYISSKPQMYTICDTEADCLSMSKIILDDAGVRNESVLLNNIKNTSLPFPNDDFDIVISFNSLEHLCPLEEYLKEIYRVIKPGGQLVGGIPCEGGLVWGLGRYFTTRRYVHKTYNINYDKIICWEHPNFADSIFRSLDRLFRLKYVKLHPLSWLPIDFNLVASFVYRKEKG